MLEAFAARLSSNQGDGPKPPADQLAISLFYFLRGIPKDKHGVLLAAYDYGRAACLGHSFGYGRNGYEQSLPKDRQFLIAEPGDYLTEPILEFSSSPLAYPSYASDTSRYPCPSRTNPFRRLSPELHDLILVRLTSAVQT